MSSLLQAMKDRASLIWVEVDEPSRVVDSIPNLLDDDRTIYLFDHLSGLVQWMPESKDWKVVLHTYYDEEGEERESTIDTEDVALPFVLQQPACVYIMNNAHTLVSEGNGAVFGLLLSLHSRYRNSFFKDNADTLPTQIVMLSTKPSPPEEIIASTVCVSWGFPTVSELTNIVTSIASHYGEHVLDNVEPKILAEASHGLREKAAIETYLSSIRTTGKIDTQTLKDLRLQRLRENSNLQIVEPTVKLSDVGGLDNAKRIIQTAIMIHQNPEEAKRLGLTPLRRILLLGISGGGKSYLCEGAANGLGTLLAKTSVTQAFDKFVGNSEKNIAAIFDQINALAPISVWFDEIGRELSGGHSSDYTDGGVTSRVHGTFLTKMQELREDVFVFAAANDISALPPEMLRADRFDKILFVGFPSLEERKEIFGLYLPKSEEEFDVEALALATPCFTGAEIKALIQRTIFDVSSLTRKPITTKDILNAVPLQKNRIWIRHKALAVSMYANAYNDYEWASSSQYSEARSIMNGQEPHTNSIHKQIVTVK